MAAPILNAIDVLSGEQGEVWATLDDGRRMCMMHVKNIETNVEFEKELIPILGKRGKGHKKTGETYSGSMTCYYVESVFRKLAEKYKNQGIDWYFDIQIVNEDNTSRTGRQVITLLDCNFDSMVLAKLDADSAALEEDMDFTFEDYRIETVFNNLDGLF